MFERMQERIKRDKQRRMTSTGPTRNARGRKSQRQLRLEKLEKQKRLMLLQQKELKDCKTWLIRELQEERLGMLLKLLLHLLKIAVILLFLPL
jgi:hypothetical protein